MPSRQRAAREEWVTPEQFAEELQVPLDTVHFWAKQGRGPVRVRFGRCVRYRRVDIDHWVKEKYAAAVASGTRGGVNAT